jgi:Protein of unknown function (DUF998)
MRTMRVLLPPPNGRIAGQTSWLRLVRLVSLAGIVGFVGAVAALHGLRGDLNPFEQTISEYSLGRYGWLMRGAFGAFGLAVLAIAIGVCLEFEPSISRLVGLGLLVAAAVGLFLDAGFNTDRLGVAETFDGAVHGDGMLILCLTLPSAAYVLGSGFVSSGWAFRARVLQALGPAQVVAILGFEASPMTSRGLMERIAVGLGVASCALVHSILHSAGSERAAPGLSRTLSWTRSTSAWAAPDVSAVSSRMDRQAEGAGAGK